MSFPLLMLNRQFRFLCSFSNHSRNHILFTVLLVMYTIILHSIKLIYKQFKIVQSTMSLKNGHHFCGGLSIKYNQRNRPINIMPNYCTVADCAPLWQIVTKNRTSSSFVNTYILNCTFLQILETQSVREDHRVLIPSPPPSSKRCDGR
jgi:hypothetical protein